MNCSDRQPLEFDWCWRRAGIRILSAAVAMLLVTAATVADDNKRPPGSDPSGVVDVVSLDESDLKESSGLEISIRSPSHFWTHNDSGDDARVYAFDRTGRKTGHARLPSVEMDDWEDIAGFLHEGVPRLLVADCGDNSAKRSHVRFYLFDEPDPTDKTILDERDIQSIHVTYADGPRDCEAVAVDVASGQIILVTKGRLPLCGVYTIPLPPRHRDQQSSGTPEAKVIARRIMSLPIPMVTAMDIDPVNGDLWLVSYFQTLCFRHLGPDATLQRQLSALPDVYELPRWRQIEAVAIDHSHNLWLTSEGKRPPLGRLSPEALRNQGRP